MKINNPFLMVRAFLDKNIEITLRDLTKIKGRLLAFDEHFNVCLKKNNSSENTNIHKKNSILIRGENVLFIAEEKIKK